MTDTINDDGPMQATPHGTLLDQLMDCRVPKSEREHAAAREIERLRAERESFYMDYRMKCDEETKRQAIEIEMLRADLADAPQPDDTALLRQALDALEYHMQQTRPIDKTSDAIAALRARLDGAPQPDDWQSALIANLLRMGCPLTKAQLRDLIESAVSPQPAPETDDDMVICPNCVHQFVAIPPNVQAKLSQPARVPMTREEIGRARDEIVDPGFLDGIVVAERHHAIRSEE